MIQDIFNSPIFITGAQRSGASIIARIIASCGVYTGRTSEMMENDSISSFVNQYYGNINVNKKGHYPLPNTKEILIPINWKNKIQKRIELEIVKIKDEQFWMYKSNRLCQLWPVWNYAFPNAKWIIVRRRTGDIVHSCLKTAYMDTFEDKKIQQLLGVDSTTKGWAWWVHEHEKLFVEMIETGLNCKVIWPERMVDGDYSQIVEMLKWLGLEWNDSIIPTTKKLLWNSPQMKERSK
ncbi:MAG: sulfotransferase [Patescibacteria group bacterium]|jgi:hypothetical protein